MPQPIPYPKNHAARRGLGLSIAFWAEFVILMPAATEVHYLFPVALVVWAVTIAAGIGYCLAGIRRPRRRAAVAGLVISAFNLFLITLLFVAASPPGL